MQFGTYALLQAALAEKLERSDLTDAIQGFIRLAEAEMNRRVVSRLRIERTDFTINSEFETLPAGFRGVRSFKLDGGVRLQPMTEQLMAEKKDESDAPGGPKHYAIVGTEFEFYPTPDATYTGKLTYRADLESLSDSVTTNWLLTAAPDAYFYGALKHAGPYLKDQDELATASALFDAALRQIQEDDTTQSHGDHTALRRKTFG